MSRAVLELPTDTVDDARPTSTVGVRKSIRALRRNKLRTRTKTLAAPGSFPEDGSFEPEATEEGCCNRTSSKIAGCMTVAMQRVVSAMCGSSTRWLRAMGYEQVLEVRGFTHMVLWFSALVSLTFTMVWLMDVITLKCLNDERGLETCILEGAGVLIFFASFRDCIQMIAHFDDHRQQVLKEKQKVMLELQVDSEQVLGIAKANVESLRGKVIQQLQENLVSYTREVFAVIFPIICDVLVAARTGTGGIQPRDAALLRLLPDLLRSSIEEVGDLVEVMYEDILRGHKDVIKNLICINSECVAALELWDAWLSDTFPALDPDNDDAGGLQGMPNAAAMPLVYHGASAATDRRRADRPSATSSIFGGHSTNQLRSANDILRSVLVATSEDGSDEDVMSETSATRTESLAEVLGKKALAPVEKFLTLPAHLESLQHKIMGDAVTYRTRQRLGCGKPPWGRRCTVCTPYALAVICRFLRCLFCGAPCCGCGSKSGVEYPKRFALCGIYWWQIHTRLQERLLLGLGWSILATAIYACMLWRDWETLTNTCVKIDPETGKRDHLELWECIGQLVRSCIALAAMALYVPCLGICMWNIDHLDRVMETIETIWQLEDVHRAVGNFNRHMVEVSDQVALLQAIEDRVLVRTDIVMAFGRRVALTSNHQRQDAMCQARIVADSVALVEALEKSRMTMQSAEAWLAMDADKRLEIKEVLSHLGMSDDPVSFLAGPSQHGLRSKFFSGEGKLPAPPAADTTMAAAPAGRKSASPSAYPLPNKDGRKEVKFAAGSRDIELGLAAPKAAAPKVPASMATASFVDRLESFPMDSFTA